LPALSERCSFVDVNRDEAQELAARLQAEDADRMTHQFLPRDDLDGSWSVAKVLIPEELRNSAQPTTTEVRPSRPNPDDGRGGHEQRVPGLPGGLG
jgi:hypothetical protein